MNFNNMRLANKLWLALAVTILGLVIVIGFAAVRSADDRARSTATLAGISERIKMANQWVKLTEANAMRTLAVLVSEDPRVEEVFKKPIEDTSAQIGEIQKSIEAMDLSPEDKTQLAKIASDRAVVLALRKEANQLKSDKKVDEAAAFVKAKYSPAVDVYQKSQADFAALQ